jgi:hypothetical protein
MKNDKKITNTKYEDSTKTCEINGVAKEENDQKLAKNEAKMFIINICKNDNIDYDSSQQPPPSDDSLIDWQSLTSSNNIKESSVTTISIIADFEKKILNRFYSKKPIDVIKNNSF